ncbi:MAG: hypothetical protein JWM21_1819 [Acidobacteria bacterium]|nr:hypothetical protein [Acidobacteriota bacterium]
MANKCDPISSKLHDLEVKLKNTPKFISEPGPKEKHPPKPVLNPAWRDLNNRVNGARLALRACEESLISNAPVPLTLTLTKFVCLDQSDEIWIPLLGNTENDEPYALVFAVDINPSNVASIPVGALNSKMTLVGALSDVDAGEEYAAPANVIWGLSNAPSRISSATNLIVLVVMMENDNGSPNQVRTLLDAAGKVGLANVGLLSNTTPLPNGKITRQELINRMIAEMDGAMRVATAGITNFDDHIGPIQELRFSQAELDHIYRNLGPIEKSLTFEGDDAKYVLKFRMFR